MININPVIKNVNRNKVGTVYLYLDGTFNGERYRKFVNLKISLEETYFRNGKIKPDHPNARSFNKKIQDQVLKFESVISENPDSSFNELTNLLEKTISGHKVEKQVMNKPILEYFKTFIEDNRNTKNIRTVMKYNTVYSRLETYLTNNKLLHYGFKNLDHTFFKEYTKHLKDLDLKNSSIHKEETVLRVFLNYYTSVGINSNLQFKSVKKTTANKGKLVALTKEDIKKLKKYRPKTSRLKNVKYLFLFQIYTGMRVSDLKGFDMSWIKNNSIVFDQFKTLGTVKLPLTKDVQDILKHLKNDVANSLISEQKYNEYIKELCSNAKIDDIITSIETTGNKKERTKTEKFKLVSNHSGRITFITNQILAGVPIPVIMRWSGHTDLKTFEKYIRLAESHINEQEYYNKFVNYLNS